MIKHQVIHDAMPLQDSQQYLVCIIKLGQLITKRFNQVLTPFGLTFNQVSILFVLTGASRQQHDVSMHELSAMLDVSLANTSGLIDRLERDGYVQRVRKADNRRTYYLALTPKGQDMVTTLEKHWPPPEMRAVDQFLQSLPTTERTVLSTTLKQLMTLHQPNLPEGVAREQSR